jgi:hypothetical protein
MKRANLLPAAALAVLLLAAHPAEAGRPLIIDDADAVAPRRFELEAGAWGVSQDGDRHLDVPLSLTYGLPADLELGVVWGWLSHEHRGHREIGQAEGSERESGLSDLALAAKWLFAEEGGVLPRQALAPTVKFPTANRNRGLGSGETDYDLTWIASKSLGERIGVHLNAGYAWIGESGGENVGDILHYGAAADYWAADALQWVGEVFTLKDVEGGGYSVWQYKLGLRWFACDGLVLDAAAGSGLSADAADFTATAGLTWTFGFQDSSPS